MRSSAAILDVRRPESHDPAGFTLLELLVAMTLLGLLMTALFGGLQLGARVWEVSERVLDDEGRTLAVRRFLHDRLEQAFPVSHRHTDGGNGIIFSGSRTTLRFASTMPDSLGFGPFFMELILQPGPHQDARPHLSLRWRMIGSGGQDQAQNVDERVLISGLSTIAFAYFGTKNEARSAPAWHETWQDQAALPELIRLEVELAENSVTDWPPLIVSPRVNAWHDTNF